MFFTTKRPLAETPINSLQRATAPFASDTHGLQLANGPNPLKAYKSLAVLATGILGSLGASTLLFDDGLSRLFGAVILSIGACFILSQQAKALGAQRRIGSNLITQAVTSWGLFTNRITLQDAEQIASVNDSFNLINGASKLFDDWVPPSLKDSFEYLVNQQLVALGQAPVISRVPQR